MPKLLILPIITLNHETMEDNQRSTALFQPALQAGIIMGFVLVIFSILTYVLGIMAESYLQWIMYILVIAGIFIFTRKYRDENLGGYINYGRALGFGVVMMIFAALISTIYTYIFYKWIDPSQIEVLKQLSEQKLYERGGLNEQQIEMALKYSQKFLSPAFLALGVLLNTIFMGFLFSLIISIFIRKKDQQAQM